MVDFAPGCFDSDCSCDCCYGYCCSFHYPLLLSRSVETLNPSSPNSLRASASVETRESVIFSMSGCLIYTSSKYECDIRCNACPCSRLSSLQVQGRDLDLDGSQRAQYPLIEVLALGHGLEVFLRLNRRTGEIQKVLRNKVGKKSAGGDSPGRRRCQRENVSVWLQKNGTV